MKRITKLMVREYNIKTYDFMGYSIKDKQLDYHHLIVSKSESRIAGITTQNKMWNGAVLAHETSHIYLHKIERIEPEIFYLITSEMIDINIKGFLDANNLKEISYLLKQFEKYYGDVKSATGKPIIQKEYLKRLF